MKRKKDLLIIFLLLPVLFMFSCQDENKVHEKVKGKISLNLLVDPSVTIESGRMMAVNTDSFRVSIKNVSGGDVLVFERFMDVPEEIEIDTGEYYITAESANSTSADFDNPYYTGTSNTFHVAPKEVTPVTVSCAINNFLVTIQFTDQVVNDFDSWETIVFNSTDTLIYSKTETRSGYFDVAPVSIRCTLDYTKSDLSQGTIVVTGTISEPLPHTHYIITIDATINGFVKPIDIIVDETSEIVNLMLSNYSPLMNIDGLVSYYPFNGNAFDVIGESDGIIFNAILDEGTDGSLNSAYNFYDSAIIDINSSLVDLNQDFAITHWVYMDSINNVDTMHYTVTSRIGTDYLSQGGMDIAIMKNGRMDISFWQKSPFKLLVRYYSSLLITTGEWHFLALVRKNNELFFYVNNQLDFTESVSIYTFDNVNFWSLGAVHNWDKIFRCLRGRLDEIRFYARSLDAEEIDYLYNSKK